MDDLGAGDLNLGHIMSAAGLDDLSDVILLRHTFTSEYLRPGEVTQEAVHAYARTQDVSTNKFPAQPPRIWLNFIADGGRRSRYFGAFVNHGELLDERTDDLRSYELTPSPAMSAMANRLVIEWGKDTINWSKPAAAAANFKVVEIADPEAVPFPGFDRVLVDRPTLQAIITDARYASWRTALGAVQGIYLITDRSTGEHYVGKADGGERILGRWSTYAQNGHGGNKRMKELVELDAEHSRHFQWSILRVFGPSTPKPEVDQEEAHFKRALMSREFGLNEN